LPFDGERIVSSTEALSLPAVPKRMLVVGAGAVGLELGSVWRRLGAEVTVAEFLPQIVSTFDKSIARLLQRALEKQGLVFRLETSAASAERTADGVRVTLVPKSGEATTIDVDVVLVAVGRRAFTTGLGAREAGVAFDDRGRIVVNDRFETSVPGIFAIGDCIAGPMLAHKAEEDGVVAVEMMAGQPGHFDWDRVPNVVYTAPELASVGIGEDEAARRGIAVKTGTSRSRRTPARRRWPRPRAGEGRRRRRDRSHPRRRDPRPARVGHDRRGDAGARVLREQRGPGAHGARAPDAAGSRQGSGVVRPEAAAQHLTRGLSRSRSRDGRRP
jgi:pyruvate/2-oxoglutarate dehydrogenase complex dihydrolipoamide dehydrogenase (E3) component